MAPLSSAQHETAFVVANSKYKENNNAFAQNAAHVMQLINPKFRISQIPYNDNLSVHVCMLQLAANNTGVRGIKQRENEQEPKHASEQLPFIKKMKL